MPNRSVKSAAIPVETPFSLILLTDGISLLRYAYPMLTLTTGPFAATLGSCATHGLLTKRICDNRTTMIPRVGKLITDSLYTPTFTCTAILGFCASLPTATDVSFPAPTTIDVTVFDELLVVTLAAGDL